jgi:hypothetical protein
LLAEVIDYAGLFPPASLSMADAVSRYAGYRRGPHAWMLGRFIVPAQALPEFEQHAQPLLAEGDAPPAPWRVSALASATSSELIVDVVRIKEFFERHEPAGRMRLDTVEVKYQTTGEIARVMDLMPPVSHLWFEATAVPVPPPMLDLMKRIGPRAGAKLRAGGITPTAIPEAATIAEFLLACARANVPCKMTAGLHHPVQAPHRLTYADDSPTALMHGFVNVFLTATLARELVRRGRADADITPVLVALLREQDPQRIVWHDDHVAWRAHRLELDAIAGTRASFAASFGSCSFDEPVHDLEQLGWL